MPDIVVVTGVLSFVAGPIVDLLIQKGYVVHGTLRSKAKYQDSISHLQTRYGTEKIKFFEADLLSGEEPFVSAMQGAKYCIHTASPWIIGATNPEEQLIRPALEGTRNVLRACAKVGIKRVVVTSSMAAVSGSAKLQQDPNHSWNEDDWNEIDTPSYALSKVLAEKEAWKLAEELKLEVVCINPSWVIGGIYHARSDSPSVQRLKGLLAGLVKNGAEANFTGWIDGKDVARAHVHALLSTQAQGRYVCSNRDQIGVLEIAREIEAAFPKQFELPTGFAKEEDKGKSGRVNSSDPSKLINLIGPLTSLPSTVKDIVSSFREFKFI